MVCCSYKFIRNYDGATILSVSHSAVTNTAIYDAYRREMVRTDNTMGSDPIVLPTAYMMQCYSEYKGLGRYGKNVDYGAAWRKVAVKFYGYKGKNVFMIDFGSCGNKKRKPRHGRRR